MLFKNCQTRLSAYLTVLAIVALINLWFVSFGSFGLLEYEYFGPAYDSLGAHLANGSAKVNPYMAKWEAFVVNGVSYIYFGPFPALLRIVPNLFFPELFGKWSRASVLLASLLAVLAFMLLVEQQLAANTAIGRKSKLWLLHVLVFAFAFGTPLLFLVSNSYIYHEAIIWGLASAVWGVYFFIRLLTHLGNRYYNLLGLSAAAGAALLSRVLFGVPLYFAIAVYGLREISTRMRSFLARRQRSGTVSAALNELKDRDFPQFFCALLPAILAFAFQLWYNHARFGSIFCFIDFKYYHSMYDSKFHHLSDIGGEFNVHRLAFAAHRYLGWTGNYLSNHVPFVHLHVIDGAHSKYYPSMFTGRTQMRVLSLLFGSTWLMAGALLGAVALLVKRKWAVLLCIPLFCFTWVVILGYFLIQERYAAEFLPLLIFLTAFYLAYAGSIFSSKWRPLFLPPVRLTAFTLLCAASIFMTTAATLQSYTLHDWERAQPQRRRVNSTFQAIDRFLGIPAEKSGR